MLAEVSPSSWDSPLALARARLRGWGGMGGTVRIQLAPSFSPQGNLGGPLGWSNFLELLLNPGQEGHRVVWWRGRGL